MPLDLSLIHNDCIEMFAYFNMKLTDALIKATKFSLEKVKQRATRFTTTMTITVIFTDLVIVASVRRCH